MTLLAVSPRPASVDADCRRPVFEADHPSALVEAVFAAGLELFVATGATTNASRSYRAYRRPPRGGGPSITGRVVTCGTTRPEASAFDQGYAADERLVRVCASTSRRLAPAAPARRKPRNESSAPSGRILANGAREKHSLSARSAAARVSPIPASIMGERDGCVARCGTVRSSTERGLSCADGRLHASRVQKAGATTTPVQDDLVVADCAHRSRLRDAGTASLGRLA